jgi:glycosyltransferase involved in cell wall biosynthesis
MQAKPYLPGVRVGDLYGEFRLLSFDDVLLAPSVSVVGENCHSPRGGARAGIASHLGLRIVHAKNGQVPSRDRRTRWTRSDSAEDQSCLPSSYPRAKLRAMASNAEMRGAPPWADEQTRPSIVFLGRSRVADEIGRDFRLMLAVMARHLRPIFIGSGRAARRDVDGVLLLVLPTLRPALLGGLIFYSIGPFVALATALRHHAGAIVCQSPYEAAGTVVLTRLIPRSIRPRVVVDAHGDWQLAPRLYGMPARRALAPATDRLANWVLRHADWVRATSAWLAQNVRRAGYVGPIETTITFSDFEPFLTHPLKPLPERPAAVFVGRLDRVKGVDTLLAAWTRVAAQIPSAHLTIVGDGPQSAPLRQQALRLGVQDSVTFAGTLSGATVRSLIDDACVLILPSHSEGFGRIIVEAMARGRPVVASNVGAIPELVGSGTTGVLVPAGNSAELARATIDLLTDRVALIRMSEAARSAAVNHNPAGRFEASVVRLARWAQPT